MKNKIFFKQNDILSINYIERVWNGYYTHNFVGRCIALKKKNKVSSVILRSEINNTSLEKLFYIYSPSVLSVKKLKVKFNVVKSRCKKLYFLRHSYHKKKNRIKAGHIEQKDK